MDRAATDCVVKVGGGRGFVVVNRVRIPEMEIPGHPHIKMRAFHTNRLIVTAAHCLPKLPRADQKADAAVYKLLGTLDGKKKNILAECLFADPVADVAVLGSPDGQMYFEEAEPYDELIPDDGPFLKIAEPKNGPGWVLSLKNKWCRTTITVFQNLGNFGPSLAIGPDGPLDAGMSGSPILNDDGEAVSLIASGAFTSKPGGKLKKEQAGGQPILARRLPEWLLHGLRLSKSFAGALRK
jgi:hypothetical protein